jgi:hypothetical protein
VRDVPGRAAVPAPRSGMFDLIRLARVPRSEMVEVTNGAGGSYSPVQRPRHRRDRASQEEVPAPRVRSRSLIR